MDWKFREFNEVSPLSNQAPLVSVVMPVFRPHLGYLEEAVDSILRQTMDDWELIVVEDPSDRVGGPVFQARGDSRIRYLINAARIGLARQHNLAVANSRGTFIARFDCDDICEPNRLAKQVAYLRDHSDIDVIASQLTIIDGKGAQIGVRNYPLHHDDIVRAMHRYNPISGSNALFKRTVVEEIGGWRENVHRPAQDYEWYSRAATRGFRFATHPEALVRYRRHAEQIKSKRLRGTILTTLEVKRKYWVRSMDAGSLCLFAVEWLSLLMPARLVLWILRATRYK